jgi:YD repeat-containing protein
MYVDHPSAPTPAHRFNGYFFTYPGDEGHRGLVSTVQDDPPMLNWVFVDADTRAVRHAGRKDSAGHVVGPWGWSEDERWLVLRGSAEGFVVSEEEEEGEEEAGGGTTTTTTTTRWAVYWDPDGMLRGQRAAQGRRCVPVVLRRRMKLGMESRYVKGDKQ